MLCVFWQEFCPSRGDYILAFLPCSIAHKDKPDCVSDIAYMSIPGQLKEPVAVTYTYSIKFQVSAM